VRDGKYWQQEKRKKERFPNMLLLNDWKYVAEKKDLNLHKTGSEGSDVAVAADVLAVEGEAVVDHGDDEPREEDVEGALPHFRRLDQHDQLLEHLVQLLLLRLGQVRVAVYLFFLRFVKKFK
jgi:hypothetical protein